MKYIILTTLGLIITVVVLQALLIGWKIFIAKGIIKQTQLFTYSPDQPAQRILVIGDSTAYGTGAKTPDQSTAGYIHQDYPNAEIINLAQNGAQFDDVINQLTQATGTFDLVLIQAGANDILYFTPLNTAKKNLEALLVKTKQYSENIVLLTSGNIGAAPIFMPPLSWVYSYRSEKYLAAFEVIATNKEVSFVKLFQTKKNDPFTTDRYKYYAADGLHLTSEGYYFWYQKIKETMQQTYIKL